MTTFLRKFYKGGYRVSVGLVDTKNVTNGFPPHKGWKSPETPLKSQVEFLVEKRPFNSDVVMYNYAPERLLFFHDPPWLTSNKDLHLPWMALGWIKKITVWDLFLW